MMDVSYNLWKNHIVRPWHGHGNRINQSTLPLWKSNPVTKRINHSPPVNLGSKTSAWIDISYWHLQKILTFCLHLTFFGGLFQWEQVTTRLFWCVALCNLQKVCVRVSVYTCSNMLVAMKEQRGLKAPVPQTYRWVWLTCCRTRRKLAHSNWTETQWKTEKNTVRETQQGSNSYIIKTCIYYIIAQLMRNTTTHCSLSD